MSIFLSIFILLFEYHLDIDRTLLNGSSINNTNISTDGDRHYSDLMDDSDYKRITGAFQLLVNLVHGRSESADHTDNNMNDPKVFDYFLKLGLHRTNYAANFGLNESVADRFGLDQDWYQDA